MYRGLELDESRRLPAGVDVGRNNISLGVLSKTYALAGLRIGWIATHDAKLRDRIARLKDYTTICGSAPSEALGIIALRAREHVVKRSRGIIEGNLPLLDAFFSRNSERFLWVRPHGGSVAFPKLRTDAPGAIEHFCDELVEQEGILLLPGSRFDHPGNHFRIGFGRADMPAALEGLEEFLDLR